MGLLNPALGGPDCETMPLFRDASMHSGFATKKNNILLRINEFDVIAEIGKGAFGSVYLVEDTNTRTQYAMKVMPSKQKKTTFGQQPFKGSKKEEDLVSSDYSQTSYISNLTFACLHVHSSNRTL